MAKSNRIYQHYDYEKGWENTNPGWHEHRVSLDRAISYRANVTNILDWLYTRVDKCERHCRWCFDEDVAIVRFRHERDAIMFRLSW